jgi:hypothetical protein
MYESFGARLRHQREERDIALVTIVQQTKIKLSLLEALERDDVSHWPAGIFRRAFVRAYAHAIGLNPDDVVREFLTVHPDPAEIVETGFSMDSRVNGAQTTGAPPTRLREMVDSAIGSLSRRRRGSTVDDRVPDIGAGLSRPDAAHASPINVQPPPDRDLAPVAEPPSEPIPADGTNAVVSDSVPLIAPPSPSEPDLLAVANLCTEFGRVERADEVQPLLEEAARLLDAVGLIVWLWDELTGQLSPGLVHGYSDKVLAQLPAVRRDADNVTAAAFRSAQTCTINGSDHSSGALVVPLLTPSGCAGVLAIELQHRSEQTSSVRAVATILAALLAPLVGGHALEHRELRHAAGSA